MARILTGLLIGGILAVIGIWYVTVYDTAEGRCDRGDLGACTVLQQRADARAQAEADMAAAEAEAAMAAAADLEEERGRAGRCFVRMDDHAATVRISGPDADATCEMWREMMPGWSLASSEPVGPNARSICTLPYGGPTGAEQTLTVLDTGGATYGAELCQELMSF